MARRYHVEFGFDVTGDGEDISDAAGEAMDAIEEKFREKELRIVGGSWSRNPSQANKKDEDEED